MKFFASFLLVLFSAGMLMAQGPSRIEFNAQSEIDQFPLLYPNCTEIPGDVLIISHEEFPSDIYNLDGLNQLTSIGGNLIIHAHTQLESLEGLDNLTNINGNLQISYNTKLVDISALSQLGNLHGDLVIIHNPLLSECSIEIICAKVSSTTDVVEIAHNGDGCNSIAEVEAGCTVGFSQPSANSLNVFPNPAHDVLNLQSETPLQAEIYLFDTSGKVRKSLQMNTASTSLDISDLPGGMYLLQIYNGKEMKSVKVVKE
jgi:hypothetical protein